ncbi:hypothetical protein [Parabacteroides distasonis]|uniref:hypothetical protein n=1 Tax=Parabacteroides distasonis TaxID=823 RepID=UPI0032C03243
MNHGRSNPPDNTQEHENGICLQTDIPPNGRMLLFFCWLFAILVPLGTPLMFRYFSWIVAFAVVMMLCFLPDLFCQLRYTAGRREALREYYGKMKHPGRKLAKIVLIAIALTVVNVALMFHFGFIHWA